LASVVRSLVELGGGTTWLSNTNAVQHSVFVLTSSTCWYRDSSAIQRNGGNNVVENLAIINLCDDDTILSFDQIFVKGIRMSLSQIGVAAVVNGTIRVFGIEDGDTSSIIHNGKVYSGFGNLRTSRDVDICLEVTEIKMCETIVESR
jgi:hypothetical protein